MDTTVTYKVLWVDDDEGIIEGTIQDADEYGIVLDRYSNWQEAEIALKNNFDDYSAIILDAFCQINPSEDIQEGFIHVVLPSLTSIFGEKNKYVPWYILSAGTMSRFNETIKLAKYHHKTGEWGKMVYIKDVPDEDEKNSRFLYENIVRVAKNQANNVVLYRHKDVFSYLGKDKLIDERARKAMLKMLSALYAPEENIKYEYAGNPLRKVVEYIFRSARKLELLTDECFDNKDHIVLLDASRYLAGLNINCYDGKIVKYQARWGKAGKGKDGAGGDAVFTSDISMLVKNILNYSNSDSHTYEEMPYFIDEQNKELFFGYVMQLCHVIKWFGKYADEHPNVEENKKNQRIIKALEEPKTISKDKDVKKEPEKKKKEVKIVPPSLAEDFKGRKYLITNDGDTLHCGSCKLESSIPFRSGQVIIIEDVVPNEGEDKEKYPFTVVKATTAKY